MQVLENKRTRLVRSEGYNTNFDKETGLFMRWGKTKEDDPVMSPVPEIADIEISSGMCHNSCPFCYKSNMANKELHNMTFEQFKNIFHKLTKTVVEVEYENGNKNTGEYNSSFGCWNIAETKDEIDTYIRTKLTNLGYKIKNVRIYNKGLLSQIAFGITSPKDNPDFFRMMQYSREFDVIPNYTCNGVDMTQDIAERSVKVCGAIALSACTNREETYNAIKRLSDLGFKQINIHQVSMTSTYEDIINLLQDTQTDDRLKGLNAIVLLKYKPKGTNAGKFTQLNQEQYNTIFNLARSLGVSIGFDSCSCYSFLNAIEGREDYDSLAQCAEPCESTLFSIYINSECKVFPCSFCETENRNGLDWNQGISLLDAESLEEIWQGERFKEFRTALINKGRMCPMYNLGE